MEIVWVGKETKQPKEATTTTIATVRPAHRQNRAVTQVRDTIEHKGKRMKAATTDRKNRPKPDTHLHRVIYRLYSAIEKPPERFGNFVLTEDHQINQKAGKKEPYRRRGLFTTKDGQTTLNLLYHSRYGIAPILLKIDPGEEKHGYQFFDATANSFAKAIRAHPWVHEYEIATDWKQEWDSYFQHKILRRGSRTAKFEKTSLYIGGRRSKIQVKVYNRKGSRDFSRIEITYRCRDHEKQRFDSLESCISDYDARKLISSGIVVLKESVIEREVWKRLPARQIRSIKQEAKKGGALLAWLQIRKMSRTKKEADSESNRLFFNRHHIDTELTATINCTLREFLLQTGIPWDRPMRFYDIHSDSIKS